MIELDDGIVLPKGKGKGFKKPDDITDWRWRKLKPEMWQRAYMHCLYSLPMHFDLPLHSVVPRIAKKMLEASDPFNVALRFMGEMELAGYIKFERGYDERVVIPTQKFLNITLDCERAPDSAVTFPKLEGEEVPRAPIRGGISDAMNKHVASVTSDMANEKFEINGFILGVLKRFPPEFDKTSSAYMFKRAILSSEILQGKRFRFPYFLDSRSRMYTDTTCGISPQGADHEKALIIPAHSEVLTSAGYTALLETAAGYSEQNWTPSEMALHASDPEKYYEVWKEADKPYSYLACAKLILRYVSNPLEPLPSFIPLDGRCSGLQHWSAVVRSNAITRHLGMHEEEAELDIYEKVAEDWKATLPPHEQHLAVRKSAKIPVMTWGYTATMMTSMDWLAKLYGAKSKWDDELGAYVTVGEGLERAHTSRLGADLFRGMQTTLAPLQGAVTWVCDAATAISKANNVNIRWPTPDGFTCMQRKVKGFTLDLDCKLSDGSRFQLDILDFSQEIPNTGKHRSAIAPNVIHSLDATHLRMVARRLKELGLPMIFIHDSFATHCNYREVLYDIIIETFVELYSRNYLLELKDYWESMYEVELDSPPELGDWDVNSLKGLKRFFL